MRLHITCIMRHIVALLAAIYSEAMVPVQVITMAAPPSECLVAFVCDFPQSPRSESFCASLTLSTEVGPTAEYPCVFSNSLLHEAYFCTLYSEIQRDHRGWAGAYEGRLAIVTTCCTCDMPTSARGLGHAL